MHLQVRSLVGRIIVLGCLFGAVGASGAQQAWAIPECAPAIRDVCRTPEGTLLFPDPPDVPVEMLTLPDPGNPTWTPGGGSPGERYTVNSSPAPFASARNRPGSFFVNSVRDGTPMTVVRKDGPDHYLGDIDHYPNYFCGWVMAANLDNDHAGGGSRCPSNWDMAPHAFSQYINCEACNGGWGVTLQHDVTFIRNVYPWAPNHEVHDYSISRPAGYEVFWRYVTEDGRYVAISDPGVEHLKWFFVPKSALPATICNRGQNAKQPSDPNKQDWGLVCKAANE